MPNTEIGMAQWAEMYPRLVELCENPKLSAAGIAEILNDEFQPAQPVTRHSVIGKLYRSNLRRPEGTKLKVKPQMPQIQQMPPLPAMFGLSILELTGSSCRWPIGGVGADMRYCGVAEAAMPGVPYCNKHARMAYQQRR